MRLRTLAVAAAALLSANVATAQTSATTTVGADVPLILSVTVDRATADFPVVTLTHLRQGYVDMAAPILISHSSNATHSASANTGGQVAMTASAVGGSGTVGRTDKPVTDITLSVGGTAYDVMTSKTLSSLTGNSGSSLFSSSPAGDFTGTTAKKMFLRLGLNITLDTPGRYTAPLIVNAFAN